MTEFVVLQRESFPHASGGTMLARVTYEDRYADGELALTERRRLRCAVTKIVDAAAVHAALSGPAARLECTDSPEAGGRPTGAANSNQFALEDMRYAHWYILDRGWSIPLEGEFTMRIGDITSVRKWSSKLISFER